MANVMDAIPPRLRILHVFRAPIGGLFRHVLDLAGAQAADGHAVGIVCDVGGGPRADAQLAALAPRLELGVRRLAMRRVPGPWDLAALMEFQSVVSKLAPDVVHGHGAKGGLMARAAKVVRLGGRAVRAYTPHGGSLNFGPGTKGHRLYATVERVLAWGTDVFTFESQFASDRYTALVGPPKCLVRVVRNGAHAAEFEPVEASPNAADLVFLGEFRVAKGLLVLVDALALLRDRTGRETSVILVGSGPEENVVRARIAALHLSEVRFHEPMPAREALTLGRKFILPSLFESLPYVLIEAAAAGMDIIATHVGGVSEAMGPASGRLVPAGDPAALANAIAASLADAPDLVSARQTAVREHVRTHLSVPTMVSGIESAYRDAMRRRA